MSDGFWIVSTILLVHVQVSYVLPRGKFWFNKVSYFGINMRVCSQLFYHGVNPLTHAWHLSHPQFKGCISSTCFCWSLCANDSQLIWKFARRSNATYPKQLPLEFLVGNALVGVNIHGRCAIVAPLPQITKLPKNHKLMISRCVNKCVGPNSVDCWLQNTQKDLKV